MDDGSADPGHKADWHREDIAAEIRKTGVALVELSRRNGLHGSAVSCALRRPWPSVELIIAEHLGKSPADIWPSRYTPDGKPIAGGWVYPTRRSGAAHRQNCEAA